MARHLIRTSINFNNVSVKIIGHYLPRLSFSLPPAFSLDVCAFFVKTGNLGTADNVDVVWFSNIYGGGDF